MKLLTLTFTAGLLGAAPSAALVQGLDDPIPAPILIGGPEVQLQLVTDGMVAPNYGTSAPGVAGHLYVVDQVGILWSVNLATGAKSVFLDASSMLVPLGIQGLGSFDERGFLGVAFHPLYATNGLLYTYTSQPASGGADFTVPLGAPADHESVITEWHVANPSDPTGGVDMTSAREILRIAKPQFNHNAGCLAFGPDDMLYIGIGDGGEADDQGAGHVPGGNAQETGVMLGKVLRIDPLQTQSVNGQYGIPADNPFFPGGGGTVGGMAGCADGECDEIFAFGLRNPFRFSFDQMTGDLLLADVGQNDIEEVNFMVSGGNYGWPLKEGTFCFNMNGDQDGFVLGPTSCSAAGLIDPIAEYDHDEGIAVIGGFVYRGTAIPRLRGIYVFGELLNPKKNKGRLLLLDEKNYGLGTMATVFELNIVGQKIQGQLLGLAEDAQGNLYALSNGTGTPFRNTGRVEKIVPMP